MAPPAKAKEAGSSPSMSSTSAKAMTAPTGWGALVTTAAQNCWAAVKPASRIGIATLVPSGTFWSAMARITNTPRPARSEA